MNLRKKVFNLLKKIPAGKVTTYKEIARAVGKPKCWRAVAKILAENPTPMTVPCHRVIRSDGRLGGYRLGIRKKEELLRNEGVQIYKGMVNLEKYMFKFE